MCKIGTAHVDLYLSVRGIRRNLRFIKKGKARSEDGINRSVPSRLRTNPGPGREPTRWFSFRERKEIR